MNSDKKSTNERGILLVSYPKIVFLYPTWVLAFLCGLYMYFIGDKHLADVTEHAGIVACGWSFLLLMSLNLLVIAFDFPRATSLTLIIGIVALVLGSTLIFINFPNVFPAITGFLRRFNPVANSTFYMVLATMFTLIYAGVYFSVQFDYWEVRPNELLHHHGMLSDLERFPSPGLRINKEINDIFEYLLLGSGRLILNSADERRSIVIDNVFFISSKEKAITKLLGALQVQVRPSEPTT